MKDRSEQLCDVIRQACYENGGAISFAQYMHLALYQPGLGYYSGGLRKFGAAGDFITAPEVSPLFSQCIARQVAGISRSLAEYSILEFGAGSGIMASDVLCELERLSRLPESYLILEVSAELRQRQRDTIASKAPQLLSRVHWLDALPVEFNGVVLANEVLDAMPVECFRIAPNSVEQLYVNFERDVIGGEYRDANSDVRAAVTSIEARREGPLPAGYCSEVNLNIRPWIETLFACVDRGVVLLIDYGYGVKEYYLDDRASGTLMCHYQQRAHTDPFWYPGLQDITAYVDFSDVAHAAVDTGFALLGYTTQAAFLMTGGLADLHQEQASDDVRTQMKLSQQIKTLTMPSEMGERFKVMALSKNLPVVPGGFAMNDLRNRL